jgi:biotin carboxylase
MTRPVVLFVNVRKTRPEGREAVLAAHRAGYDVALLADRPPPVLPSLFRAVEITPTYDRAGALAAGLDLARRVSPVGVLTWADRDVELTARLARELGLRGLSADAARQARDKHAMRAALAGTPELIPRFARVTNAAELAAAAEEIGYPAILKPAGVSGSKGIFDIRQPADLPYAFDELLRLARPEVDPQFVDYPGLLVYEELLEGTEHSAEGYVHNGRVTVVGITDKWATQPFHSEYQEIHPSALPSAEQRAVHSLAEEVVRAVGLDSCAFHLECKVAAGRARLFEVAARVGGGYIGSHLIPLSTGATFYENVVRIVCGEDPVEGPRTSFVAGGRSLITTRAGALRGISGLPELLALDALEAFSWELPFGTAMGLPPEDYVNGTAAGVIVRGGTHADVATALEEAVALAKVEVEPTAQAQARPSTVTRMSGRARRPTVALLGFGASDAAYERDEAERGLRQALGRGYRVLVADTEERLAAAGPAVAEAAQRHALDPGDVEACRAWALTTGRRERVEAVYAYRGHATPGAAAIAAAVGARGNAEAVVHRVRRKDVTRTVLRDYGFRQPTVRLCCTADEASVALAGLGGRAVVKPLDGSGSGTVTFVEGPDRMGEAVESACAFGKPFIVEEYVDGRELSVEGLVTRGAPHVLAVVDKETTGPPHFVETGHTLPAELPKNVTRTVAATAAAAVRALGLAAGPFHVECWLVDGRPIVGDVDACPGGGWIHLMLEHAVPGLEICGHALDDMLGRTVDVEQLVRVRAAAVRYLVPSQGLVASVGGIGRLRGAPTTVGATSASAPPRLPRPLPLPDAR